ncbi:MAG: extracellular solute-binding protein [Fimbriimonadaceae bacterium]
MRRTFGFLFLGLAVLSLAVWRMQPRPRAGVIELVRVSDSNPLRLEQCDLFNRENPGVHVTLDPSTGIDKVIVQSLGGVGPDVFDAFDPFELSAYAQGGIALDITDELAKRGIDLKKIAYPGVLPTAIYQGRVYGIPTNLATDALWVHRDILEAAGIPEHKGPWTWSDFIPIAQRLTVRDAAGQPIRYGFEFEWWQWRDFFTGFGARVFSDDGTRCTLGDGPSVAAVSMMHDLVYKYHVSSTPIEDASMATEGGFGSGGMSIFGSRHAAIALGGRWWLAQLRTYKGLNLGVMEAPYGTVRKFFGYGRATLINKASPHRKEDLDFLLYQLSAGYNDLVNSQADGISAFGKFNRGAKFLHDPAHPAEADNATWRAVAEHSVGADASPYVSGQVAAQIITDQMDLVQADAKSPAAAMRDAGAQINAVIARNLAQNPNLAQQYGKAAGK